MLTSVEDLEYMLGWEVGQNNTKSIQRDLFVNLSDEEKIIVQILKEFW